MLSLNAPRKPGVASPRLQSFASPRLRSEASSEKAVKPVADGGSLYVEVRRQQNVALLGVQVLPSQTVKDLKEAIAKSGGVAVEDQRIFLQSRRLPDEMAWRDCFAMAGSPVSHRLEVQLVPTLRHRAAPGVSPVAARRGFNMMQGSDAWRPSAAARITHEDLKLKYGELQAEAHPEKDAPILPTLEDEEWVSS
mmetsp:Transcript_48894/g.116233  ORF Transcript_48894/g.116233 Transcript_48894/m.116233 type:complete len:194 (+) Transcript_48894:66-647(+)